MHILTLSPSASLSCDQVQLFPIHSLVLTSHCTHPPPLPPRPVSDTSSHLSLPILRMSIPSPSAFAILHEFMYNHQLDMVLKSLLPLPLDFLLSLSHPIVQATLSSEQTLSQLSNILCSSVQRSIQTLNSHAAHVK